MAIWYEGNLNQVENQRERNGITYYVRGISRIEEKRYERYGVHTHFIEKGENYIELLKQYVMPLYEEGDIISISEKVISMCQNQVVERGDIKVGFWAKFLAEFAAKGPSGPGMSEPYKMQLAINMKGLFLVIWAAFLGGVGKLLKKRGIFYEILGSDVAGIDGFFQESAFEKYRSIAILNPKNPKKVCKEIYETLAISVMIVDANDLAVEILGFTPDLEEYDEEERLVNLIQDNPAGQDDECTPFVIIRDIKDAEAECYVPKEALKV